VKPPVASGVAVAAAKQADAVFTYYMEQAAENSLEEK